MWIVAVWTPAAIGQSILYRINLTTGAATVIGRIATTSAGENVVGFAIAPPAGAAGVLAFQTASVTVDEAAGVALVTVARTGGGAGAVEVAYQTTGGTATIAAGTSSTQVSVTVLGNSVFQPNREFLFLIEK